MSLSIIGTPAAAAATSITLPTHQRGDLIILSAYRDGSTTAPTKPAAAGTVPTWTDIDVGTGANLNMVRTEYAVATANNHTSGTWTNATGMAVIVLRGQADTFIGGHASAYNTGLNTVVAPSITQSDTSGAAALLHFLAHRSVTAWSAATAGYTLQASVATEMALATKNSTTSDGSLTQACTAASSGYAGATVEVLAELSLAGVPYIAAAATNNTTNTTDASVVTTADMAVGDTLFVIVPSRLGGDRAIATVTGHGSTATPEILFGAQTGTQRASSIYRVKLTSAVTSGTTLTVTMDGATSRKVTLAIGVPGLKDQNAIASTSNSGTTGNPTTGSTGAIPAKAGGTFSLAAYEHDATANTETGTPDTGWQEILEKGVGASSWLTAYAQYKRTTSTTAQNPTWTPSLSSVVNFVGLIGVWEAGPDTVTVTAPLGTGTGVSAGTAVVAATIIAPLGTGTAVAAGLPTLPRTVVAPLGTGSGVEAGTPVIAETILPPLGTGSAVGLVPTLVTAAAPVTVTAPLGTGSGVSAGTAVVAATILPPLGTGVGVGLTPVVPVTLTAPLGTGSGRATTSGSAFTPTGLINTAEGQADGTTPTAANSGGGSGDAFAGVAGMSGAGTFATAAALRGSRGYRLVVPASSKTIYVTQGALGSGRTSGDTFGSFYVRMDSVPVGTSLRLHHINDSAGSLAAGLRVTTGGLLRPINAANVAIGSGTVGSIPLNTKVRIDWRYRPGTSAGEIEYRAYWTDPDGTSSPDYSESVTGQALGADIDSQRVGCASTITLSSILTIDLDDLQFDTTGFNQPTVDSLVGPTIAATILPPVGTGSGVGLTPTLIGPTVAPVGTGVGVGLTPGLVSAVLPPLGTGVGVGIAPSVVITGAVVSPPVGTGVGVGATPTLDVKLAVPLGTGSGVGLAPDLGQTITPPVGTGSGSGLAPQLPLIETPGVGHGSGVGLAPSLSSTIAPPLGTGTSTPYAPSFGVSVTAPLGTGSAVGLVPTLPLTVTPPLGTGVGVGLVPLVQGVYPIPLAMLTQTI